jgi:hypothetical protein
MSNVQTIAVKSLRVLKMLEMKIISLERTIKNANPEMYKSYVAEFDKVKAEAADELKEIERIIRDF